MEKLLRDFISHESRSFSFKIGEHLASSLSGFLAGVVVASIVWIAVLNYIGQ